MARLLLRESRDVDAPPEVVWETASDTSRYADGVPGTLEIIRTDGPARAGSTYAERTKVLGPITATAEWEIIQCDEPRRQVHRSESIPMLKPLDIVTELEPLDGERTRFLLSSEGETALGSVGRLAVALQRSSLERDIAITADHMQASFEAAAAARAGA